jgi:hypothetical protein
MRPVELRELLLITIQVRPIVDLGGGRRYVAFDGGTFVGRDGLAGTVLEGGVDWQRVRPDGVSRSTPTTHCGLRRTKRLRWSRKVSARRQHPSRAGCIRRHPDDIDAALQHYEEARRLR